jgi:hypothetical protein
MIAHIPGEEEKEDNSSGLNRGKLQTEPILIRDRSNACIKTITAACSPFKQP